MVALGKQAMEPGEAVGCVTLPPDEMATRAAEAATFLKALSHEDG